MSQYKKTCIRKKASLLLAERFLHRRISALQVNAQAAEISGTAGRAYFPMKGSPMDWHDVARKPSFPFAF